MSKVPEIQNWKDAYTDAPTLKSNLLLGSLQLLFRLFFHPSAWRNYVFRIDSHLQPHFCLIELGSEQRRHPALRRLLIGLIFIPVLTGLLGGLILLILGEPIPSIAVGIATGIIGGIAFGIAFSTVCSLAGGLAGGAAAGITASVAIGMVGDVIVDLVGSAALGVVEIASDILPVGVVGSVTFGVIIGISGGVIISTTRQKAATSLARQIGSIVIGALFVAATYGIALGIAFGLISGATSGATLIVATGATVMATLSMAAAIAGRLRSHSLGRGVAVGIAFSTVVVATFIIAFGIVVGLKNNVISGVILGAAGGVGLGAWITAFFAFSYAVTERIAGPSAGATAGVLGAGGVFILWWIAIGGHAFWLILLLCLACIVLGLTQAWWRPVALYPLTAAWNLILYQADERRTGDGFNQLRRHSVFWDEHQRLPLFGLDEHLVLIMERNRGEGKAAMTYVATTHQRWAAIAAQIELDARSLETCQDVSDIRQVHRELPASELAGPASALLRSFSRISQDVDAALNQESRYNQRLSLSAVEDRLDSLLRELTRSSERYAIRFRPIADYWRQIISTYVHKLTEQVEVRQEIRNPYVIGVPLTAQQEVFVGRVDVSARIEELLREQIGAPLLLYGQRRTGKTSLLNNLGRLLPSAMVPLFVDLQGPASRASDHTGFLYNIARNLISSAQKQRGLFLPALTREELTVDPFTCFDEWLDEVELQLGQNSALLALDEFEALEYAFSRGYFDEQAVLGMLRYLIQHRPRFKVLLAGSHTLDEFQRWASYLINVQVIDISYLQEEEAYQLITRPINDFALHYDTEAAQRVMELTHCHPFLIQLLCSEIVALKNEQEPSQRRRASLTDVETAVPEALKRGRFYFADIEQNQMDSNGRILLHYLAAHGEGTSVSQETLTHKFPNRLDTTLNSLLRREILEKTDESYRFQIELIRRWFVQ